MDVRVLAATHRDLEAMVAEGSFRRDLLYRLNAVTLEIPPLRARPEEISTLADRFFHEAARSLGRELAGITDAALEALVRHRWPGNIRELKNAIERAVVIAEGQRIVLDDLPKHIAGSHRRPTPLLPHDPAASATRDADDEHLNLRERVRRYEARIIEAALHRGRQPHSRSQAPADPAANPAAQDPQA